jgi:hypothetical protein
MHRLDEQLQQLDEQMSLGRWWIAGGWF